MSSSARKICSSTVWKPRPSPIPGCQAFSWGYVTVFVGIEAGFWHLSISTPYRNPTWEEIKQARYDLIPDDVTMAMILPPLSEHVNLHEHCFHLHQIPGEVTL